MLSLIEQEYIIHKAYKDATEETAKKGVTLGEVGAMAGAGALLYGAYKLGKGRAPKVLPQNVYQHNVNMRGAGGVVGKGVGAVTKGLATVGGLAGLGAASYLAHQHGEGKLKDYGGSLYRAGVSAYDKYNTFKKDVKDYTEKAKAKVDDVKQTVSDVKETADNIKEDTAKGKNMYETMVEHVGKLTGKFSDISGAFKWKSPEEGEKKAAVNQLLGYYLEV